MSHSWRLHKIVLTHFVNTGYLSQVTQVKKFLNLNPRPTMSELKRALMPLGWDLRRNRNYVPDDDEPGYLKYNADGKEYDKLLKEELQKRKEIIQEIIKNRDKDD